MVASKTKPRRLVLLSSIGVERCDVFPFKILNSYGVLDCKRAAEDVFLSVCRRIGSDAIVVRPGRLVGAPFTNFDLAKLLQKNQGEDKGIVIDVRENLAGDVERKDVASAIAKLIEEETLQSEVIFSIINKPGKEPTEREWGKLLSLFTVSKMDYSFRREV